MVYGGAWLVKPALSYQKHTIFVRQRASFMNDFSIMFLWKMLFIVAVPASNIVIWYDTCHDSKTVAARPQ